MHGEAVAGEAGATATDRRSYRIEALDLLRGLVIVVMALDHVRDFTMAGARQEPAADPQVTLAVFLTRWATHFCAPGFTFLAGISAGLMLARMSRPALARLLVTRGFWLLVVEVLLISTAITMAPFGGRPVVVLQTLSAIGVGMIALAGLQFLGPRACLAIGAAIVVLHNALDPVWPQQSDTADVPLWAALHSQMGFRAAGITWYVSYPFLPWIGVITLGFGCAPFLAVEPERRTRRLAWAGGLLIAFFLLLRASHLYGDPHDWSVGGEGWTRTLIAFLNTTKYPPSLLFLAMTLGPAALFAAWSPNLPVPVREVLRTYGRVPFAFYVAHFWLIRLVSLALGELQGLGLGDMVRATPGLPDGFGIGLGGVYLVWIGVVAALYPGCRAMAALKARRKDWWLSYL